MPVHPPPREVIEVFLAEQRQKAEAEEREARIKARIKNVEPAIALGKPALLCFHRWRFHVPPVPFEEGLELQALRLRIQKFETLQQDTPEVLEEMRSIYRDAAALYKRLVRPRGLMRLSWPFLNPFKHATFMEVAQLLGFFCACRMRSTVRFPAPAEENGAR